MTAEEREAEFCRLVDDGGERIYMAAKKAHIGWRKAYFLRPAAEVRKSRKEPRWHWTRHQELLLIAVGRGELAALAKRMGRTYFAAYRHRERLLKCSDASGRAKG